jgi:aminopeptidase N
MAKYSIKSLAALLTFFIIQSAIAQPLNQKGKFTHQDTLRGSITPERAWWDVQYYNIQVTPDYESKSIKGCNQLSFKVVEDRKGRKMQIDLQQPMVIDSIIFNKEKLNGLTRVGNVYYLDFGNYNFSTVQQQAVGKKITQPSIKIFFHGTPREAINPPWDGGWIWGKDALGRPWMTVACQGLGASVWYPCKDHQSDEPDLGAMIQIKVPDTLVAVANGRLYSKDPQQDGTTLYTWRVQNPINNYNIVPYIGKYVHWSDEYMGEKGKLSLDYWVLDYNLEKSKQQFNRDVKPMIKSFEYWFGPYPFYEDGYKLVESSHLGMEHQSATAYGNHYMNGYLGMDLSGSGWGKKWDYIIVHESGHEWFGNNITTKDIADMWIHEGFTDYSETLFVESQYGKEAANAYTQGLRRNIGNKTPVIGPYGVNQEGSGDMYNKGNNILHTIRQVINDDELFRSILRGLNADFYHQTVSSKDVEAYFSKKSGKDLSKIFDQYLRTTMIPVLEYKVTGDKISYRWGSCIAGFNMPVKVSKGTWLHPTNEWQDITATAELMNDFKADPNFYITVKKL